MTGGAPLDATDTVELAELLDFTADTLSWVEGHVVYADLQAPLRRWARRLRPDAPTPPVADSTERSRLPSCHDAVTMSCPVCQRRFTPTGRQVYCGEACKAIAYRRRRDTRRPAVAVPKGRPRRSITVYACDACGERALGDQYCQSCSTFMRRVGIGGSCPTCDAAVAIVDLIDSEVTLSTGP